MNRKQWAQHYKDKANKQRIADEIAEENEEPSYFEAFLNWSSVGMMVLALLFLAMLCELDPKTSGYRAYWLCATYLFIMWNAFSWYGAMNVRTINRQQSGETK